MSGQCQAGRADHRAAGEGTGGCARQVGGGDGSKEAAIAIQTSSGDSGDFGGRRQGAVPRGGQRAGRAYAALGRHEGGVPANLRGCPAHLRSAARSAQCVCRSGESRAVVPGDGPGARERQAGQTRRRQTIERQTTGRQKTTVEGEEEKKEKARSPYGANRRRDDTGRRSFRLDGQRRGDGPQVLRRAQARHRR